MIGPTHRDSTYAYQCCTMYTVHYLHKASTHTLKLCTSAANELSELKKKPGLRILAISRKYCRWHRCDTQPVSIFTFTVEGTKTNVMYCNPQGETISHCTNIVSSCDDLMVVLELREQLNGYAVVRNVIQK